MLAELVVNAERLVHKRWMKLTASSNALVERFSQRMNHPLASYH